MSGDRKVYISSPVAGWMYALHESCLAIVCRGTTDLADRIIRVWLYRNVLLAITSQRDMRLILGVSS